MDIKMDLYQGWDTLDEAIDFFLNLCLELLALQRLPDPPANLFIHVTSYGEELTDMQLEGVGVTLESL